MVEKWRERISSEDTHFRELAALPGSRQRNGLPIENHSNSIFASIEANSICGVRSPPGSGKTMILPELLYGWAENTHKRRLAGVAAGSRHRLPYPVRMPEDQRILARFSRT